MSWRTSANSSSQVVVFVLISGVLVSQFAIQSVSETTSEPVSQSIGQYELAVSQLASTGCKPVGQSEI